MTVVAVVFTPVLLLNRAWTYRVCRARVESIEPPGSPVDVVAPAGPRPPAVTK